MKLLSFWAKNNLYKARLLLILGQTLLVIIAFLMGAIFSSLPYFSPETFRFIGLSLFFIGLILYPIKNTRWTFLKHSYFRQKCMDGILIFSSLFLFFGLGQQLMEAPSPELIGATQTKSWKAELVVHSRTTNISPKASKKATRKQKRLERKQLRKSLKKTIKKHKKGLSTGVKVLLILLTLLLSSVLIYGLLFLSCSLVCSGMEVLAYIVLGGGSLSVVTLALLAIKRIIRKTKKETEL